MDKYYVYSLTHDVISVPMSFNKAKAKQDEYNAMGDRLQILKIVVDDDGKVVN